MRPILGPKLKGSGQWLDGMTSAISNDAAAYLRCGMSRARALLLRDGISERRVMMLHRG
ncbi:MULTISPECIES: hypothetical protein [Aurantimonas]|uniref:hypothetical protein n=1 Tax=Aurantimonas TaxID=182269 RepID=UPI0035156DD6